MPAGTGPVGPGPQWVPGSYSSVKGKEQVKPEQKQVKKATEESIRKLSESPLPSQSPLPATKKLTKSDLPNLEELKNLTQASTSSTTLEDTTIKYEYSDLKNVVVQSRQKIAQEKDVAGKKMAKALEAFTESARSDSTKKLSAHSPETENLHESYKKAFSEFKNAEEQLKEHNNALEELELWNDAELSFELLEPQGLLLGDKKVQTFMQRIDDAEYANKRLYQQFSDGTLTEKTDIEAAETQIKRNNQEFTTANFQLYSRMKETKESSQEKMSSFRQRYEGIFKGA